MRSFMSKALPVVVAAILIVTTVFFGVLYVDSSIEEKANLRAAKQYVVDHYEPHLKVRNLKVWRFEGPDYCYQVKWPRKAVNGQEMVDVYSLEFKGYVNEAIKAQSEASDTGLMCFFFLMICIGVFRYWEDICDLVEYWIG